MVALSPAIIDESLASGLYLAGLGSSSALLG